ncbi:FtsX-like permease family protein [Bacillus sp. Bva_UNVM-123]|uniref:ABC transporter permease n=1 Tax=Bacillus sp. Bva_UNVM-123 TaxID=2829798 RepID=UPI00391F836B
MMFPNNNKKVIAKLTSRTLRNNKTRNRFVILAIVLTTLLITFVFSIGMSFLKSIENQHLKMMGTLAHAALTLPTDEQVKQLEKLDYVEEVGLGTSVAYVSNTPEMGNISVNLHWFDQNEWNTFRAPLNEEIVGSYPEAKNEILAPTWILKAMGIENPEIGMEISLTYTTEKDGVLSDEITESFVLSGWYTEYVNIRSGNIGSLFVSTSFAESKERYPAKSGAASIIFNSDKNVPALVEQLEQDIKLSTEQKVKIVPLYDQAESADTATLIGYIGVVLFLVLSGYLLIYNVLYISVSRDTRFYGLLKTIGTTAKQIRRIVIGQALKLAFIGIPIGIALGMLLSFVFVPMALSISTLNSDVEISFSPVIFIGAAIFALITTLISCTKPARVAGKVSPIEAIRYTGTTMKARTARTSYGSKLNRMALRNIFREKKRAFVVFLSLFLGLTTFMTVNTLVLSMDTDNFVDSYWENEFDLYNNTMSIGYEDERKDKITEDMVKQIEQINGVTDVRITYIENKEVKYDPDVFVKHVDAFANRTEMERPSKEELLKPNRFVANAIGIDTKYVKELNQNLEKPIDMDRFNKGEIALLGGDEENFKLGDRFELTDHPNRSFEIGGFVNMMFQAPGGMIAPNTYISHEAFKQIVDKPMIYKLNIKAEKDKQPEILEQLRTMIAEDRELYLESKLETAESMQSSKITLYILGGGIAFILAFIGILNYINTMYTGVRVRRIEFAVMESIGMTRKQLTKMLLLEGTWYGVISTALIAILGSLISYGAFKLFRMEATYAIYTFPWLPFFISIILVFGICLTVPLIAYNMTNKLSIIERLRE